MLYFQELFERLSLTKSNGLFMYNEKTWENLFPVKIKQTLQLLKPHAFFVFNKEPIILFFDDSVNNSDTHTACWNFNVTPIIFFVSKTDVKIHNAFEVTNTTSGKPLLKELAETNDESNFSYWNLVSGQTFEIYQKQFEGNNRVDKKLLSNIKEARNILIANKLQSHAANSLIGRLIFVRYLIDREIGINFQSNNQNDELLRKEDFWDIISSKDKLYELFSHLEKKFDGDLFPIDEHELANVKQIHLNTLQSLFKGDDIGKGQLSLFDTYRFDIIPIEFISNVYEYFMGEGKQKDQKAYYTPTFLVNYMLNHTVSAYFDENPDEIVCKILDPTCGSGIFLVEGFRRIVGQYEKKHGSLINNSEVLTQIASQNIFGIDKDSEAISVAMFSLYITLLDYQNPKSIKNFKFPSLLNTNFFVQDIFKYSAKDLQFELLEPQNDDNYIAKLLNTHFQFILGNPPWGQVPDSPYMQRMKEKEKLENIKIGVSDKQFAQAFLARTRDFCSRDTKCAVIVASKVLYNNYGYDFRKYFLDKFFVDEVLELSPVRKDVFVNNDGKKAIAPCAVLFYRYAQNQPTENNQVTHTSIKHNIFYNLLKVIVIEKNDIKTLKQSNFQKYDWIWKVLLYGNALDFQFIKRLKEDFSVQLSDVTELRGKKREENIFTAGTGLVRNGTSDAKHLLGKKYLDLNKGHLKPFRVAVPDNSLWNHEFVQRVRINQDIFYPPMLLTKSGSTNSFQVTAGISYENLVFTKSTFSIKSIESNVNPLYYLVGLFSSQIVPYFLINIASSLGVERENVNCVELLTLPYQFDEKVANLAQTIENELKTNDKVEDFYKIIEGEQTKTFVGHENAQKLRHLYNELNEAIYDLYDVNDIERSLIDYAENVSIPLFHNEPKAFRRFNSNNQHELEIYANVFYGHFGKVFNGRKGRYFQIEAIYNKFFVCMTFKILNEKPSTPITISFDENLGKGGFLANLALYKEGENLYTQKDIKHFEANEFFIIKPNEIKCWHKALAHKDLFEIREEIIKSSQKQPETVTA